MNWERRYQLLNIWVSFQFESIDRGTHRAHVTNLSKCLGFLVCLICDSIRKRLIHRKTLNQFNNQ